LVAVTIAGNRFFLIVTLELNDYLFKNDCLDINNVETNGLLDMPGIYLCEIEIKDTKINDSECETEIKVLFAEDMDVINLKRAFESEYMKGFNDGFQSGANCAATDILGNI
jgi:hypothetical protein